jgi:hypothetical protein
VVVHITLAPRANMGQTGSLLLCALEHGSASHGTLSGSERGPESCSRDDRTSVGLSPAGQLWVSRVGPPQHALALP